LSQEIINTAILATSFLALFGSAELLYHRFKVKAEITRKYVHFSTGFITLLFPPLLGNHWYVLFLCASFAAILLTSLKFKLLPSINAVDRVTRGSILYPIVVYGCYLAFDYYDQNYQLFYIPILILAVCDPIAALTGKTWPKGSYTIGNDTKTMMGSSMFFIAAIVTVMVSFLVVENDLNWGERAIWSATIALVTTLAEAVSGKGYDNLTIPGSALLVLILMVG
jgi:phytol kinase